MITRSEGSAPGCRTGHEPTPSFYTRWECLNDWLASHAGFWRPAPFKTPSPQWEGRSPGLVRWLDALDPAALDYFDRHPAELASRIAHWVPGMADYPALTDLSAISPPEAAVARVTLDEVDATDMPGRKRAQAGAFAAAILPLNGPVLDWCCGKGHLTRTLARQCTAPVNGFEWDAALVEDGNRLAARFSDRLTIHCQDVMAPELRWPDVAHGVALHACGDLHRRLIAKGSDSQAPRISFSPCCYHRTVSDAYHPMATRVRSAVNALVLSREELRLAVQETVTAPARVRAQRVRVRQWRLGFDALQRALRGVDDYLPVPSHPSRLNHGDFEGFCQWAAAKKGLPLPDSLDWVHWRREGERRHRQVQRHELLRHLFRRPLELWLVLDYAVFLEEQGYEVRLGTFCERALTPRNLLVDAVRVSDTPRDPRSHP
ncbi:methyltransferase [Marinobacter koreensis]|uniref:Methyltransferase n=1 Tax=Marinobacter koreensis TaxID=335974 RepID=A0ABW0RNV4_9GAMM|nr:methyltransferase [Marinobacter koreensis]MCK7547687.1 SAM-dependent methyltransferase [Marinobacter koreensis]